MSGDSPPMWTVIGGSVRGAAHVRKDLPNQDAWGAWQTVGGQPVALGVVADGHGSSRCVRSDVGARFAVEVTHQVVSGLARELGYSPSEVLNDVPELLVSGWRERVANHLLQHPITHDDFPESLPVATRRDLVLDPVDLYGTTLVACLATPTHLITIQLGDGDVLVVTDKGRCVRVVDEDADSMGNETHSLCELDPHVFRVDARRHSRDGLPLLVLISTDGVSNAFRTDEDFFQLGTDLARELTSRAIEEVVADLPGWLSEFSSQGSGDDVTLCLLVRPRVRPRFAARIPDLPPTRLRRADWEGP